MQSFQDASSFLKCSDCKSSFDSASSLLQHFAQHISQVGQDHEDDKTGNNITLMPHGILPFQNKEKKAESILENVLKRSTLRYLSLGQVSTSDTSSSSSSEGADMVTEIGLRARVKGVPSPPHGDGALMKCDLQKRLESCIYKLASKRSEGKQHGSWENGEGSGNCTDNSSVGTSRNEEHEEVNPLKFCIISVGEGEANRSAPRGASSRKQQSPKKISTRGGGEKFPEPAAGEKASSVKRRYPCHLCSKVFGWSTDLKRHILTHTGERPFKCLICHATFTRNFLLQKHEAKFHTRLAGDATKPGNETKHKQTWARLHPVEQLQCNRVSAYEIYSQKALNIL